MLCTSDVWQTTQATHRDKIICSVSKPPSGMQVEASSALSGIGLVRLMGRSSGFIAMEASLASGACRATKP